MLGPPHSRAQERLRATKEKLSASMACKDRARLRACWSPHCDANICYDARPRQLFHVEHCHQSGTILAWGLWACRWPARGRQAGGPWVCRWPDSLPPRVPDSPPASRLVSRQAHAVRRVPRVPARPSALGRRACGHTRQTCKHRAKSRAGGVPCKHRAKSRVGECHASTVPSRVQG